MYENFYENIMKQADKHSQCVMITWLEGTTTGLVTGKALLGEELKNESCINERAESCIQQGKVDLYEIGPGRKVLIEPFIAKPSLVIFGGGHIAKPLCEFATRLGFTVTIIDDRPSFANTSRFPEAERVICESFEKSFDILNFKATDYVVIITRGHRYDGVVLRNVLKYDLNYMGMIGSKRRVKAMKEELLKEGFSGEKLEMLHAPIGIDIEAITPDEISVSILAQLINYKNRNNSAATEFDPEVLRSLCKSENVPRALITILSSKGSVPRKAGTKMLTFSNGRTIGTIGGGCSESSVLQRAREAMRESSSGFCIEHVDMTGDVAESEGMVCGGTMEVLIEVI